MARSYTSTNFFADWRFFGWLPPKPGSSDTTGDWVSSDFLDVLDFADPVLPTLRAPVSLPGQLAGISHSGAMLYTTGPDYNRTLSYDYSRFLTAAAYDGVAAFKVDTLPLGDYYRQSLLVMSNRVCLGYSSTNYTSGYIETWKINDGGHFERLAVTDFDTAPNQLTPVGDNAAVQVGATVGVLRMTESGKLETIAIANPSGCLYPQSNTVKGDADTGYWVSLGDYGAFPLHRP